MSITEIRQDPKPLNPWTMVAAFAGATLTAACLVFFAIRHQPPPSDVETGDAVVISIAQGQYTRSTGPSTWHDFKLADGTQFKLRIAGVLEPGDHVLATYTRIDAENVTVHSLSRCGKQPCRSGTSQPVAIDPS